jgi:hypothetical protein
MGHRRWHFALGCRRGILDHTFNHPVRTSLPPFAAPIDQRPSSLAVAALCVPERNLTDEQEQDLKIENRRSIARPCPWIAFMREQSN